MPTTNSKEYDFFISYAQADSEWVDGFLVDLLNEANVKWHSEKAFHLGVPRILEFENAINKCERIILVLTPAYFAENPTPFFDVLAQNYGLESGIWPLVPLILKPVDLPTR